MSFSQRLTELNNVLVANNHNLEFVYTSEFKDYLLQMNASTFVEAVFVFGNELRDVPGYEYYNHTNFFIKLLDEIYQTKKDEIEKQDQLKVKYNLGLIDLHLYFCQKDSNEAPMLTHIDDNIQHLKQATILANQTIDIAKGIYHYITIRTFEYIYTVFNYYQVPFNGVGLDVDSFYVFSDQLDTDDTLWLELIRQVRTVHGLPNTTVATTDGNSFKLPSLATKAEGSTDV